jgi:hypothetical protein
MPLKDVVGGQTNLLHRSAWDDPGNPLKVRFDPWENSAPTVKDPEQVQIFLDGVEIGVKSWTGPISPSDLYVPISADKLPSGEHSFTYLVTIWSGTPHDSYPFTLTVDKDLPQLNGSSQLIFDTSALPPATITEESVIFSWDAGADYSTDTRYEVYLGEQLLKTLAEKTFRVTGMTENTGYVLKVRAKGVGHYGLGDYFSAYSSISFKTPAYSGTDRSRFRHGCNVALVCIEHSSSSVRLPGSLQRDVRLGRAGS